MFTANLALFTFSIVLLLIVCTMLIISLRIKTRSFKDLVAHFVDHRVQRRLEEQKQAWLNRKYKV